MKTRITIAIVVFFALVAVLLFSDKKSEVNQPASPQRLESPAIRESREGSSKGNIDTSLGFDSRVAQFSGELEIPHVGKIAYARSRSFQLRDFVAKFGEGIDLSPILKVEKLEYHITVFEDADGNFLHLEHCGGRYPTSNRGEQALAMMKAEGIELTPSPNGIAPLSDPDFARVLVSLLNDLANSPKGELDRETSITFVLSRALQGAGRSDESQPSLLLQDCSGMEPPPNEAFEPADLAYEDAIKRVWAVRQILRGSNGALGLKGIWGRSIYERRADGIRNEKPNDQTTLPR